MRVDFWMMVLVANLLATAFATSICVRLKLDPELAKNRSAMRNTLLADDSNTIFSSADTDDSNDL